MKKLNKDTIKTKNTPKFMVYIHIRPDTNQPFYVGKGKKGRNRCKSGRNPHWHNIVNKNKGVFKDKILFEGLTEDEALKKEREVEIKLYNKGIELVNIIKCGIKGNTGMKHTEETKQKISKAKKGIPNPKISKAKLGKKMPKEIGRRISEANKNKPKHSFSSRKQLSKKISKAVLQFNLEGKFIKEYSSIKEAEIDNHPEGALKANISSHLNGYQKTAYGYKWKYKN